MQGKKMDDSVRESERDADSDADVENLVVNQDG